MKPIHALPWMVLVALAATAQAAPPWTSFLPFKRSVSVDEQEFQLREEHGPWLVLAASFAGDGAEEQARELVLELRKKFQMPAYIYSEEFDYTEKVAGLSIDKFGERKKMRYANAARYDAIAVLIGDFAAVDDPELEKTLEKVKYARPDCLDITKRRDSAQRFAGLRHLYRKMNGDESKRTKGPMGSAFVTRNPLLPDEYFTNAGVDDFVASLNKGVKHGLLDAKGKFTVRVATFRGDHTIDARKIEQLEDSQKFSNKLEVAADMAHRLTEALRKRGVEAYEFHDRHESVVTVGIFQEQGTPLPDGTMEINPAILRVMQQYSASRQQLPGQAGVLGLQPKTLDGIPFDVQPLPMAVPRRSLAADYARGRGLLR